MAGPELEGDIGFDGTDEPDEDGGEMRLGEAELNIGDDDGIVSGFDGFEDDEEDDGGGSSGSKSGGSPEDIAIAEAIENGMAEMACFGLEGSERQEMRKEMRAIAGQFHLGYFGEKCVKKYLKTDIENIPPEYGLAAAMVAFAAVAIYKRPDGDEYIEMVTKPLRDRFGDRFGSDDAPVPPQPEPEPESGETTTEEEVDEGDNDE